MTPLDHLRAAARCWEHTGFYEGAAERFTTAEAWCDAGRCFSQTERHSDASLAYSRAGEALLEAREHLMASWLERARPIYERLGSGPFVSPSAQVEVLLGAGQLEEATHVALSSGDREAVAWLARLTSARGRPDLAAPWWPESFAPWNRSLRLALSPPITEPATWPSVEFSEVSLVPIWSTEIENPMQGSGALAWSDDANHFAAVLDRHGLVIGDIRQGSVRQMRWKVNRRLRCARFLPNSNSLVAGSYGDGVFLITERGNSTELISDTVLNRVLDLAFSPLGEHLALAGQLEHGAVLKIYNWAANRLGDQLVDVRYQGGTTQPRCAWSADGQHVAWSPNSWDYLSPCSIIDLEGRQTVRTDIRGSVSGIQFTPNHQHLVCASGHQTLTIHRCSPEEALTTPLEFDSWINGISIHAQAALLILAEDNRLQSFRLLERPPWLSRIWTSPLRGDVRALTFSPDGKYLLALTGEGYGKAATGQVLLFRVDLKP